MPTNDKRREVARRLRNVEMHAIPDARIADNPMTVEFIAAAVFYDLPYVRGLFSRLADLIEPEPERTARMEYDEVHCDCVCTACGERTSTGVYEAVAGDDRLMMKPMRYCPSCGAKVVVDDE